MGEPDRGQEGHRPRGLARAGTTRTIDEGPDGPHAHREAIGATVTLPRGRWVASLRLSFCPGGRRVDLSRGRAGHRANDPMQEHPECPNRSSRRFPGHGRFVRRPRFIAEPEQVTADAAKLPLANCRRQPVDTTEAW